MGLLELIKFPEQKVCGSNRGFLFASKWYYRRKIVVNS
jgi:hypothetical protein